MKLRVGTIIAVLVFLIFVSVPVTLSHPHVFFENSLTIIFDQKGLAGVRVQWIFDEFFSSMIAGDYDLNHNSRFEPSEIAVIKKKAFSNLANFGYFTSIKIAGRPFKVKYVRDFSAALTGGKMIYRFFVPCHVRAASTFKEFIISQYDPTYYTAVFFAKDRPVSLEGEARFDTSYRIAKNVKEAYYFGQVCPVEVILRFRLKHG